MVVVVVVGSNSKKNMVGRLVFGTTVGGWALGFRSTGLRDRWVAAT